MASNILLIHADQHRYDALGVNGHPLVQTPNLDAMAEQGMNLTHAFSPIPVCAPARATLLTGQWPTRHHSICNAGTEVHAPVKEGIATFTECLSARGYTLGFVGKWGVNTRHGPRDFGFDQVCLESEYDLWRRSQGIPDKPKSNAWFGEVDPYITSQQSRLAWGADRVIDMLRERAQSDAPFFLRWDPSEPHLPNVLPEPYASMYDPTQIEPWPSFAETFQGKPYIQRQQLVSWGISDWRWDDWRPIVSRYFGEITLLDAQIGRVLRTLDELGLADDTLVVYTCDHGDMCGGHRMIDKHHVMYDDVVRVPLIARWPSRIKAGSVSDAFVCTAIDLARTFCEVGGADVPHDFQGISLLSVFEGAGNGRESAFSVYYGNQFGLYSQRMLRTRRWKYVWNPTAEDELYDLAQDPAELRNRSGDSDCVHELKKLRECLVSWMVATDDRLLNSWTRRQLLEGAKIGPADFGEAEES